MVGVHHIGILKSERRKPQARSTQTDFFFFFLINRSFHVLSIYTMIITTSYNVNKNNILTNVLFFCTEEKEKKFQQQIPSNIYCTFFCDTSFPFSPLCLRWTLMFNTKKKHYYHQKLHIEFLYQVTLAFLKNVVMVRKMV